MEIKIWACNIKVNLSFQRKFFPYIVYTLNNLEKRERHLYSLKHTLANRHFKRPKYLTCSTVYDKGFLLSLFYTCSIIIDKVRMSNTYHEITLPNGWIVRINVTGLVDHLRIDITSLIFKNSKAKIKFPYLDNISIFIPKITVRLFAHFHTSWLLWCHYLSYSFLLFSYPGLVKIDCNGTRSHWNFNKELFNMLQYDRITEETCQK